MHTTSLRKVGGSIMLAVPPAVLDMLDLKAGAVVGLSVDGGRLIIEPSPPPRYTLDELLAACDANAPVDDTDAAWVSGQPIGHELL